MEDKRTLTAPCGVDCFNCELHPANLTDEIVALFAKRGVPAEVVPCKGCRAQGGCPHFGDGGCATLNCAKDKGVEFCSDCGDFPCARLAPLAAGAARFPHNLKLYNLCRIKLRGFDHWAEEEAGQTRRAYFDKPFVAGKGQAD